MHIAQIIKQKPYEKISCVLRRHWFTFLPRIALFAVLFAAPVLVFVMISSLFPDIVELEIVRILGTLVGSVYYLSTLIFFYAVFVEFYLDQWIITNDRIVDIEQFGLFARTVSELELFRVQDVTTDVRGLFPTMMKYGNVHITTASTNASIIFYDVPDPDRVRQQILHFAEQDRQAHSRRGEHV